MLTTRDPYDRLEQLDAMAAIKAWLLGDYRRGEERGGKGVRNFLPLRKKGTSPVSG